MVSVQQQKTKSETCDKRKDIIFLLNKKHNIAICMKQNISFIFPAEILTYIQSCEEKYASHQKENPAQPFFNILCYGNERLYNIIRKIV